MLVALAKRVGIALGTLLAASIIIWCLLLLAPGDPATGVLHARGVLEPDPAQVAAMRAQLGLNGNPVVRYLDWLWSALHGDFGLSWKSGRPVMDEFATRLPATLRLAGVAMCIAIVLALVMGTIAAAAPRRWPDSVVRVITLAMVILPSFLVGLFVLNVLVLRLNIGVIVSDGTWSTVGWPALTLALGSAGYWTRVLRASILEARSAPYMQVCRARGASPVRQLLVHAVPNAIAPFLTIVGLGAAAVLGGAPIIESVYTWPGVGAYTVQEIDARDVPVIVAFTMIAVTVYVVASLLIDLILAMIDPRLRHSTFSRRRVKAESADPVGATT